VVGQWAGLEVEFALIHHVLCLKERQIVAAL